MSENYQPPDRLAWKQAAAERVRKALGERLTEPTTPKKIVAVAPVERRRLIKRERPEPAPKMVKVRPTCDMGPENTPARVAFIAANKSSVTFAADLLEFDKRWAYKESLAKKVLTASATEFRFNPSQPRAANGEWGTGGGGSEKGKGDKEGGKKPETLSTEWLGDKNIDKAQLKKRPYEKIANTAKIRNDDGSLSEPPTAATSREQLRRLATDPATGELDKSLHTQLTQAAAQSDIVVMGRKTLKMADGSPSPFGEHAAPETRPDEPTLSSKGRKKATADGYDVSDPKVVEALRKDEDYNSRFLYPPGAGSAMRVDIYNDAKNERNFYDAKSKGDVFLENEGVAKLDSLGKSLKDEGFMDKGASAIGIGSVTLGIPNPHKLAAELNQAHLDGKLLTPKQERELGADEKARVQHGFRDGKVMTANQIRQQQNYLDTVKAQKDGELGVMAKQHLEGRRVFSEYDADGSFDSHALYEDGKKKGKEKVTTRENVTSQALQQKVFLESRGAKEAIIMHPPLNKDGSLQDVELKGSHRVEKNKGGDEHRGSGGKIRDMEYDKVNGPTKAQLSHELSQVDAFKTARTGRIQPARLKNLTDVLHAVSTLGAATGGRSDHSLRRLAILLDRGLSPNTIRNALEDLDEAGFIERVRSKPLKDKPADFDPDWEDESNFKDTYGVQVLKHHSTMERRPLSEKLDEGQ